MNYDWTHSSTSTPLVQRAAAAAWAVIAALPLFIAACGGSEAHSFEQILRFLPPDTNSAIYLNVADLYREGAPEEAQYVGEARWEGGSFGDFSGELGVAFQDLEFLVLTHIGEEPVTFLSGLNVGTLRKALEGAGYKRDTATDQEFWVNTSFLWKGVAILSDGLVMASRSGSNAVKALPADRNGQSSSFYDESVDIVSSFPPSVYTFISRCTLEDCIFGIAATRHDGETVRISTIATYDNAEAAQKEYTSHGFVSSLDEGFGCQETKRGLSGTQYTQDVDCELTVLQYFVLNSVL